TWDDRKTKSNEMPNSNQKHIYAGTVIATGTELARMDKQGNEESPQEILR
mgnify:CR=1